MPLDFSTMLIRIGLAFLAGFILGWEREIHGRAAGLRTTVLVCIAAAIAAILSDQFYNDSFQGERQSANWHPDPARLGAGLLTGIGFLGAGVIIKQGSIVRGVTTASQIWLVTILGLCFGTGQLVLGAIGTGVSWGTVTLLHYVETKMKRDWYATFGITVSSEGVSTREISDVLKQAGMNFHNVELVHDVAGKTKCVTFFLRFKQGMEPRIPDELFNRILAMPGVLRLDWK